MYTYHKLNQVTKLDEFPLPQIDDTLDQLARAKHFTALDLLLTGEDGCCSIQEKTAFTIHAGLYEFR